MKKIKRSDVMMALEISRSQSDVRKFLKINDEMSDEDLADEIEALVPDSEAFYGRNDAVAEMELCEICGDEEGIKSWRDQFIVSSLLLMKHGYKKSKATKDEVSVFINAMEGKHEVSFSGKRSRVNPSTKEFELSGGGRVFNRIGNYDDYKKETGSEITARIPDYLLKNILINDIAS
jgi:hypothetical protein